jgi:hypothetical protein
MNIEQLAKNAIDKIKTTWGLPKSGFIAGGSIANLIWEEVSGTKAVINDIDVFLFDGLLKNYNGDKKEFIYSFKEDEQKFWYDDYVGIRFYDQVKNYYSIVDSTKDDIFNYINYKSNTDNPEIIIKSFDINCTAVGYSIEEDRFYWTTEFEKFLKTGELKITNLKTPCHTAIRIVKKKEELDVKLDLFELDILQHTLSKNKLGDTYKVRFQDRYYDLFNKYSILKNYFTIDADKDCMEHVKKTYDKEVNLWTLNSVKEIVFSDNVIDSVIKGDDLLFYLRNIYNKPELTEVWSLLKPLFINENYVDGGDIEDIKFLSRVIKYVPRTITNLRGYKLTEQISIVKKLLEIYKEEPIIAFSVLERHLIDPNLEIDESTALLYELSVRKEIFDEKKAYYIRCVMEELEQKSTSVN